MIGALNFRSYADAVVHHAEDLQRAMQRGKLVKAKKLTRVRLIVRRVLGFQDSPASR